MNRTRAVARTLWTGTLVGVAFCAAGTVAAGLGLPVAWTLAKLGILSFLATPPARLLLVAIAFWQEGRRRLALVAATVLASLVAAAVHAVL